MDDIKKVYLEDKKNCLNDSITDINNQLALQNCLNDSITDINNQLALHDNIKNSLNIEKIEKFKDLLPKFKKQLKSLNKYKANLKNPIIEETEINNLFSVVRAFNKKDDINSLISLVDSINTINDLEEQSKGADIKHQITGIAVYDQSIKNAITKLSDKEVNNQIKNNLENINTALKAYEKVSTQTKKHLKQVIREDNSKIDILEYIKNELNKEFPNIPNISNEQIEGNSIITNYIDIINGANVQAYNANTSFIKKIVAGVMIGAGIAVIIQKFLTDNSKGDYSENALYGTSNRGFVNTMVLAGSKFVNFIFLKENIIQPNKDISRYIETISEIASDINIEKQLPQLQAGLQRIEKILETIKQDFVVISKKLANDSLYIGEMDDNSNPHGMGITFNNNQNSVIVGKYKNGNYTEKMTFLQVGKSLYRGELSSEDKLLKGYKIEINNKKKTIEEKGMFKIELIEGKIIKIELIEEKKL